MVNPFWLRQLASLLLRPRKLRVRRPNRKRRRRARLILESLEQREVPTVCFWINPLGGDWDTATNWLGGIMPGAGDVAMINSVVPFTVTHSLAVSDSIGRLMCNQTLDLSAGSLSLAADSKINTLDLTGGTLDSSAKTTISGLFTWDAGTLTGSGNVKAAGGLLLNGVGSMTLDNTTLDNAGTATWTAGNVNAIGSSTFNNLNGSTFNANTSGTFHPLLNNNGTFTLASSPTTNFDTLINSGSLQLPSGRLHIGSFTQSAGTTDLAGNILIADNMAWTGGSIVNGGQLDVANTLAINSASPLLLDATSLNNSGAATWYAGDIRTVNGSIFNNLAGASFTAQSDATFNTTFNNAGTFTLVGSATTNIDTLNNSATVSLQSGTLDVSSYDQTAGLTDLGGGNTLNATNLTWTGGTIDNGGQVNALGSLFISGPGSLTLDNATINNALTGLWSSGNINTVSGSTFNNLNGATFTAQSNAAFHTTFNNDGTLLKTGSATTQIDTLNNAGTLTLQNGKLNVATFNLSGGAVHLNGHVLKASDVTWTGGTIDQGGRLDATNSLLLDGVAPMMLDGSTIDNYRSATWTAGDIGTISGGTFNNLPGASFTANSDAAFSTTFNNAGTFILGGNALTSIDTLNNYSTVALQSGTLNTNDYVQMSGVTYLNGLTLGASNSVQIQGGSLLGSGTINGDVVNGGQLMPGALGIISVNGNYTQTVNGVLWIAIGGPNPGEFDRLQVSGTADLHGTLDAYFINGYKPGAADSYAVVLYGSATSPFDVVTISNPNPAVQLGPVYGATGMAIAAVPPPLPTDNGGTTDQNNAFARNAVLTDHVFAHPGVVANRNNEDLFERLALSGAGGPLAEIVVPEAPAESGKPSFTLDLRHGAGSASMEESGADDDLVAALLAAASDFGPIRDSELLSNSDIGVSLLTRIRPKADILPPKGSRLASVATLLLGEGGEDTVAQPNTSNLDELPLHELLINPVRGKASSPASATATQDAGANQPEKVGASKAAQPPLSKLVIGSSLFLGATINIAIPPTRRRRSGPRVRGSN